MTVCKTPCIKLHQHSRQEVVANFDGARISSDAGALLLREADAKFGILEQATGCFTDYRRPDLIEHPLVSLVRQRVMGLCLGYKDISDHDSLRDDSLLALACDRGDITGAQRRCQRDKGKPLAGHATLHRLELAQPAEKEDLESVPRGDNKIGFCQEAGARLLIDLYAQRCEEAIPSRVILDLDATDSTIHGEQEGKWFNSYYDSHCYVPLYIFTDDGHVLWSELQTAHETPSINSLHAVKTIIERLRGKPGWSSVQFIIRGDSGFCRDDLMTWCEGHEVGFILGLSKNCKLDGLIADAMEANEKVVEKTNEAEATYHAFSYKTRESWSRERLVSAKAEVLPPCLHRKNRKIRRNPRYIVTHLPGLNIPDDPEVRYRQWYCPRGEMENRIKEQQLCLFADRVSTSLLWSNHLRQWFSTIAYALLHAIRTTALKGTDLATAQCSTIRTKLLKIGATIRVTTRRIWIHLSSAHPSEPVFRKVSQYFQQLR